METLVDPRTVLESLTERQVAVCELLWARKSSKEIGRALGIHPNTVDQHIKAAGRSLGVDGRNNTALAYGALQAALGRPTPDFARVDSANPWALAETPDAALAPIFTLRDVSTFDGSWVTEATARGPGDAGFSGRFARLLAILAIAIGLAALGVLVVAVMNGLNDLI